LKAAVAIVVTAHAVINIAIAIVNAEPIAAVSAEAEIVVPVAADSLASDFALEQVIEMVEVVDETNATITILAAHKIMFRSSPVVRPSMTLITTSASPIQVVPLRTSTPS
jgi:hypothetical protein